jgi:hypothetical protein
MNSDIARVLELQRIDTRLGELSHEIAALPRHIAAIEKTLDSHIRKVAADQAILAANQKERKAQEAEIQIQQQKISKLRDQTLSAKTNEQYRAFQHEIEYCEQTIRKAEDRILELMLQSEPLEANVKTAERDLAREKQEVERQKTVARDRTAADKAQAQELTQARAEVCTQIAPSVIATYEKIRKKSPLAVADASSGRCSACQMELRPQFMQELKQREQVLLCENCRRIVVYNPAVDIAGEMNAAADSSESRRVDMT